MSLFSKVGSFAAATSTGSHSVTGLGFQPKLIFFWGNGRTSDGHNAYTTAGVPNTDQPWSFSICAVSGATVDQASIASEEDFTLGGPLYTGEGYWVKSKGTTHGINVDGTPGTGITLDSDGFTFNYLDVLNASIVNYMALGGSDLQTKILGAFDISAFSTGNHAFTGMGFKPDSVILWGGTVNSLGIGFASSPSSRFALSYGFLTNAALYLRNDKAFVSIYQQTKDYEADLTSLDSDGCTVNFSTINGAASGNAMNFVVLGLKGANFKAGTFIEPGSTGNAPVTGVGFRPSALLLNGLMLPTSTTIRDQTAVSGAGPAWAVGGTDGTNRGAIAYKSWTDGCTYLDRTKVYAAMTDTGTVQAEANITSFDSGGFTLNWSSVSGNSDEVGYFAVGPVIVQPTPPLPRAFQEQGRIYSGETTGFQPLGFQIPDPGRAFQEGTRLGEPRAFQDQAFQVPDPGVAFQPEAFDDGSSFQMSVLAFQDPSAFQGDAFQEFAGLERRTPRAVIVASQKKNQRRFLVARGHRQARIIRAPQPPPAVASAPKLSIYSSQDRRPPRLARARRRKPLILRAPLMAQRPTATLLSKAAVKSRRARLRRRRPLILRSPQVSLAPRGPILERQSLTRSRLVRKVRRGRAIVLRNTFLGSPLVTGTPVKRVFVSMDRRAAFVRARIRRKQLLRAPSVPTPVPWIRNHIYVNHRARNPIVGRARRKVQILRSIPQAAVTTPWIRNHVYVAHRSRAPLVARLRRRKLQIERSTVFAVRPPTAIIRKQRRRIQQKRKRAVVLRSVPLWQRPHTPVIVGQHRKVTILARARHRLRLVISRNLGPPPPPSTASFFGQAFLSDVAVYGIGLDDVELYGLALKDAALYDVALSELANYDTSVNDSAVYETNLSDIPGG